MLKLIDPSYDTSAANDEPTITIVDFSNFDGLVKAAADSEVQRFISTLNPEPGKVYLHINAMGAGEYYGSNRNGDYFPEENLKQYYKTFETSPAHLFRNHINKNPQIANGKVIFAIYNERMHRVELIAEADKTLIQDIEERIAQGDFPSTSMACRTPYDVCSICGNKAHTRQQYCIHLTTQLNKLMPDGRKVMALNLAPLKFFDISFVIKPADVTSSVLQKVASEASGRVVGSAELAEAEGLVEKKADVNKVAELIKFIEDGDVLGAVKPALSKVRDPHPNSIDILHHADLNHTLSAMAKLEILPSLEFLAELVARKKLGADGKGLGVPAAAIVREVGLQELPLDSIPEMHTQNEIHPLIYKTLLGYQEGSSIGYDHVEKRASIGEIFDSGVERGYPPPLTVHPDLLNSLHNFSAVGDGLTNVQRFHALQKEQEEHARSWFKTLIGIGASAVLAKWTIARAIKEANAHKQDGRVVVMMTKAAMAEDLSVQPETKDVAPGLIARALRFMLRSNGSPAAKATSQGIGIASRVVNAIQTPKDELK